MPSPIKITTPLTDAAVASLRAGDQVLITGILYAARDAAHKRLAESLEKNQPPPFNLTGQIVYYVGPTPAPPGRVIGAAGPTTSGRLDPYTPLLLRCGLKGMIGKGRRGPAVRDAIRQYRAVYFAATGGAGALLGRCIKKSAVIAYEDLGPEAVRLLEVADFPAMVINDLHGGDLYDQNVQKFAR